jgi:trk system potassium uptake protein TrkH
VAWDEQIRTLSTAAQVATVAKFLGQLALALSALSLPPALAAWALGDNSLAIRLLVVAVLCLGLGLPSSRIRGPDRLQPNEALVITALAFVGASALMVWPLMGAGLSFADAWLEAVSGVTTTGLTTLRDLGNGPAGLVLARAWMQWYGGLGIVVLCVALTIAPGAAARRLIGPDQRTLYLTTGAKTHAKRVLAVYLVLTVFGTATVWLLWGQGELALVHVLAAVSTGGFAAFDDSLGSLGSGVQTALLLVSLAGAVALPVYYRIYLMGPQGLHRDPQLMGLLLAGTATSLLLAACMLSNGQAWDRVLHHAPLLGFSAQTTAGFSTLTIAELDPASKLTLILSMAVGGDLGSSAGGIKILRLLIFLRVAQLLLARTRLPEHAVIEPRLGGQHLDGAEIQRALVLILLYLAVILVSWLPFLAAGHDPLDALFEVVSAVSTCGLSTGITATELAAGLKLVLCLDMLLGRVEIVALLVVLYPWTWLANRRLE